jgi:hypothetical protein
MQQTGSCTRPELLVCGGAPAGIEPGDPILTMKSRTHRCADQRFRRSRPTVDRQVMCSS